MHRHCGTNKKAPRVKCVFVCFTIYCEKLSFNFVENQMQYSIRQKNLISKTHDDKM